MGGFLDGILHQIVQWHRMGFVPPYDCLLLGFGGVGVVAVGWMLMVSARPRVRFTIAGLRGRRGANAAMGQCYGGAVR